MAKKMINKSHIEGYLYESTLEEKVAGAEAKNPGSKYINGKLSIEVAEDNVIVIDIYESEITKKGTKNQKYDTYKNIIAANNVVANGRDLAAKIRMDSALSTKNWYHSDGELITSLRNFNGFAHIITDNKFTPAATFEVDILITTTSDDMTKNENGDLEPNGALVINGFIFDFAEKIMPVRFLIESENGIKYFRDLEPNTFTKVWGNMVTQSTTNTRVEESAFGEDKVAEYTQTRKKFVVTGTNKEPYAFGDEDVLSVKTVQEAIAARNTYLAELKTKTESRKKNEGTASIAVDKTTANFKF